MLAGITVTKNDYSRIDSWKSYYNEYANSLDIHVIVCDGCEDEYLRLVRNIFVNSFIIDQNPGVGLVACYNVGISFVLKNNYVFVALIANDIKASENVFSGLITLIKGKVVGAIPVILDSYDTIEDSGPVVRNNLFTTSDSVGQKYVENRTIEICDTVTGGFNIMHRKYYEICGLQDESLFMYSDEIDTYFKLKFHNLNVVVNKGLFVQHKHMGNIDSTNLRNAKSEYYMFRNKVYLAIKFNKLNTFLFYHIFKTIIVMFRNDKNLKLLHLRVMGFIDGFKM